MKAIGYILGGMLGGLGVLFLFLSCYVALDYMIQTYGSGIAMLIVTTILAIGLGGFVGYFRRMIVTGKQNT